MKEKLDEILKFLKENKKYNKQLQKRYALSTVSCKNSKFDKVIALLYDTVNTQSQPKIDKLAVFFQKAYENKNAFNSFHSFIKFLDDDYEINKNDPFETLFKALTKEDGWGDKTSALFVKNIINYHHEKYWGELKIWDDVPPLTGKVYLPVDSVIIAIFNRLDVAHKPKWNFKTINKEFQDNFSSEDIILFDDLWFWGFITQKGSEKRIFKFNKNKYWIIKESRKDEDTIKEIRKKSVCFLKCSSKKRSINE